MAFKMKYKNLKGVIKELRAAVKAHGKQADTIEGHVDEMEKDSPLSKKGFKDDYQGPCWDTHKMVGTKMKDGQKVPNCVPK